MNESNTISDGDWSWLWSNSVWNMKLGFISVLDIVIDSAVNCAKQFFFLNLKHFNAILISVFIFGQCCVGSAKLCIASIEICKQNKNRVFLLSVSLIYNIKQCSDCFVWVFCFLSNCSRARKNVFHVFA